MVCKQFGQIRGGNIGLFCGFFQRRAFAQVCFDINNRIREAVMLFFQMRSINTADNTLPQAEYNQFVQQSF